MLKKNPEKIIRGTKSGADRAKPAFALGAAADKNEPLIFIIWHKIIFYLLKFTKKKLPKATDAFATKTIMHTQMMKLEAALLRLDIQ